MTPTELADRYFACVRSRDLEGYIALFAPDAVMILPNGQECVGTEAIAALQGRIFASGGPRPTPLARLGGGAEGIAVEIRAELPDGSARHTANFFHLNAEGLISRLSVYMRG